MLCLAPRTCVAPDAAPPPRKKMNGEKQRNEERNAECIRAICASGLAPEKSSRTPIACRFMQITPLPNPVTPSSNKRGYSALALTSPSAGAPAAGPDRVSGVDFALAPPPVPEPHPQTPHAFLTAGDVGGAGAVGASPCSMASNSVSLLDFFMDVVGVGGGGRVAVVGEVGWFTAAATAARVWAWLSKAPRRVRRRSVWVRR